MSGLEVRVKESTGAVCVGPDGNIERSDIELDLPMASLWGMTPPHLKVLVLRSPQAIMFQWSLGVYGEPNHILGSVPRTPLTTLWEQKGEEQAWSFILLEHLRVMIATEMRKNSIPIPSIWEMPPQKTLTITIV